MKFLFTKETVWGARVKSDLKAILFILFSFILFSFQASGNKVSRKTVLCGSQNIVLNGKVIVQTGAIIRGDLSNVRTGRYCVISQKAVIRPAYKQFSTG